jgi:hypothetical protein
VNGALAVLASWVGDVVVPVVVHEHAKRDLRTEINGSAESVAAKVASNTAPQQPNIDDGPP